MDHDADLRLAHSLADAADASSMERFRADDLRVETKADLSPVTEADQHAEAAFRRTLEQVRPQDSILGEEYGATGTSARRWVIDPIDGTKNYLRGVPVWASLIALMIEDEVVVGVVSAPALGRRWWAARGAGAWRGPSLEQATRCRVSDVATLAEASMSYASLTGWESRGKLPALLDLTRACWRTRAYGDFWSYMLVAEGAVDLAAEPELNLHDMAAVSIVVEEAGGRFTDLSGVPGPLGEGAVATNGHLHDDVLAHIGDPSS